MKRFGSFFGAILLASILTAGCAQTPAVNDAAYPGASWESVAASTLSPGCRDRLAAAGDHLRTLDTTALLAAQDGRALFSYGPMIPKSRMVIAHKREVPIGGNWDVSWVKPEDFLVAARMLATAPCR